ncbi:MAG: M48 family metallopeptidase [Fibrobacter sp.]|nr:M48 family metallopeptidase [Fibrobacter sp.]
MKYVGMQTQIWRNNRNTAILLCMYPVIILAMVWAFIFVMDYFGLTCEFFSDVVMDSATGNTVGSACRESASLRSESYGSSWPVVWFCFLKVLPYTLGIVAVWFLIAYLFNESLIRHVTHAKPLERKDNLRVYNIVENLCIAGGIEMPQINIIEDSGLNAFASGIDVKSFTVTLTTGIIEKLDDDELSAVVAHELTHIKNRDTRLMVVCIVYVGLISLVQSIFMEVVKAMFRSQPRRSRNNKNESGLIAIILIVALVGFVISSVAYFFSYINRLAISRKREYVADAGAAELCGDPLPLARALRKVVEEPGLSSVNRNDVAQLYIIHPDEEDNNGVLHGLVKKVNTIFSTHPETSDRIQILEQF